MRCLETSNYVHSGFALLVHSSHVQRNVNSCRNGMGVGGEAALTGKIENHPRLKLRLARKVYEKVNRWKHRSAFVLCFRTCCGGLTVESSGWTRVLLKKMLHQLVLRVRAYYIETDAFSPRHRHLAARVVPLGPHSCEPERT